MAKEENWTFSDALVATGIVPEIETTKVPRKDLYYKMETSINSVSKISRSDLDEQIFDVLSTILFLN